jgi:hypothetical protein
MPLCVDAGTKTRGRPGLGIGGARKRHSLSLLREPIVQFAGCSDLCLQRRPTIRRKRPVRERSQFGGRPIAGCLGSTSSQGHGAVNGTDCLDRGVLLLMNPKTPAGGFLFRRADLREQVGITGLSGCLQV